MLGWMSDDSAVLSFNTPEYSKKAIDTLGGGRRGASGELLFRVEVPKIGQRRTDVGLVCAQDDVGVHANAESESRGNGADSNCVDDGAGAMSESESCLSLSLCHV